MKKVLISGASVAGPTLAYWLSQHGREVTVVERAPAFRPGGQAIDIRGVALDVVDRMGLLPAIRALRTRLKGMSVLDAEGNEIHRSEEGTLSGGRFDSGDIEIFRDDLARLLFEKSRDAVEYRFGDMIADIRQDADSVDVRFRNGRRDSYDLVVGADGLRSSVRRLVFGEDTAFIRSLGTQLAIFSAENILGLDDWQIAYGDQKSGALVFPTRDNASLRVFLAFPQREDEGRLAIAQQKALVAERCAQMGWRIPDLLKAMWHAPDFYLSTISQVHMPRWSNGRVALLGDAGFCPSPYSGQGTSLALIGAYVLAAELAKAKTDHAAAFAAYESRMRPYVALNQGLATENPGDQPSEQSVERAKNAITLDEADGPA